MLDKTIENTTPSSKRLLRACFEATLPSKRLLRQCCGSPRSSKRLLRQCFGAARGSKWLLRQCFGAAIRSKELFRQYLGVARRSKSCTGSASELPRARNYVSQGGSKPRSARKHCPRRLRSDFTLEVDSKSRSKKLFEDSGLGSTALCIPLLCSTLLRACICTGSH